MQLCSEGFAIVQLCSVDFSIVQLCSVGFCSCAAEAAASEMQQKIAALKHSWSHDDAGAAEQWAGAENDDSAYGDGDGAENDDGELHCISQR